MDTQDWSGGYPSILQDASYIKESFFNIFKTQKKRKSKKGSKKSSKKSSKKIVYSKSKKKSI